MAGRPRKTIEQLCRQGRFRAREHADRLDEEPLLRDADLRALQVRYRETTDDVERYSAALRLEQLVRQGGGSRASSSRENVLYALGPGEDDPELLGRWQLWDQRFGAIFRYRHGCAGQADVVKLQRLIAGVHGNRRADVARAWLEAHAEEVETFLQSEAGYAPYPPLPASAPERERAWAELRNIVDQPAAWLPRHAHDGPRRKRVERALEARRLDYAGYSAAQIGQRLGCSPRTVRRLLAELRGPRA
jgi:hypothetical protein